MLRDHLPVTLGRAFLGTEKTEGRGDLQQAGDEQVAGPPEQLSVWGTPVLEIEEDVAQLENRVIGDSLTGQQPLDAFVVRPCPSIRPHAGSIRADPDVGNCPDTMKREQADELLGYPAAIADRVVLHRPPRSISVQAVGDVRPDCVLWLRAVAAAPAPARPRPPARRSRSSE